jgi:rare lipoprotein A (peptidoglycan hydrolase)
VRLLRVVASAALIALLASVVVPGAVGSRIPNAPTAIDPSAFNTVDVGRQWTAMTTQQLDPADVSAGHLEPDALLGEPQASPAGDGAPRAAVAVPQSVPIIQSTWHLDNNISWYGPGFYGNQGACGLVPGGIQADTIGVAHRTLPCGTKVTFRYNGRTVTTIVIDRGPYVSGRTWDMTHGLCAALGHCFTGGGVYWHLG